MKNLLQHNASLSSLLNIETFIWREDRYLPGMGGGSKIRMFERFNWDGVKRVATTGIVQSNQVRQLTAFVNANHPGTVVTASVKPDGPRKVDWNYEKSRGSLKYAIDHGARVQHFDFDQEDSFLAFNEQERNDPETLFIPRGVSCFQGIDAWVEAGNTLQRQLRFDKLLRDKKKNRVLVLVVSGSGSTHLGLAVALKDKFRLDATVVGLSTKRAKADQEEMLLARLKNEKNITDVVLNVDASYATSDGSFTNDSLDVTRIFRPYVDFDTCPIYNGRIFQYLLGAMHSKSSTMHFYDTLVIINTGIDCLINTEN